MLNPLCLRVIAILTALAMTGVAGDAARAEARLETPMTSDHPTTRQRTGLLYDPLYLEHRVPGGFPERPARLEAIVARLGEAGLLEKLELFPARPVAQEWLETIHSREYFERARATCARGPRYLDSQDVPVMERSCEVAEAAVGGVLAVVDAVVEGRIANGFCAVRPPGHHALPDRAMGFCLFNNVAIAARYAQRRHGLERILIVDWDVHHGNGTQEVFYDDPSVLFFSIHQFPFYPGSGAASERGAGAGEGSTLNVPLPAESDDAAAIAAFREKLLPTALAFKPDLVLISAGFDAHRDDPLGGLALTPEGYAELTRIVRRIADESAGGRIVSLLEGGYDLDGLARSVEAHLRILME